MSAFPRVDPTQLKANSRGGALADQRSPVPGGRARRRTVLLPLAVLGLVVVLTLSGCGGDGGASKVAQANQRAVAAQREAAALRAQIRRTRARIARDRLARLRRVRRQRLLAAQAAQTRSPAPTQPTQSSGNGCPSGLVPQGTQACARPNGDSAGCGGNPYSTPTRSGGCIGPAHPPSSGPATNCPPGQVPVGVTGACAPK